jgi:hypothetical protein
MRNMSRVNNCKDITFDLTDVNNYVDLSTKNPITRNIVNEK